MLFRANGDREHSAVGNHPTPAVARREVDRTGPPLDLPCVPIGRLVTVPPDRDCVFEKTQMFALTVAWPEYRQLHQ